MNDELYRFLTELLATPSPSGLEKNVQLLFINFMRNYIDDITIDIHGNVIVYKKGNSRKKIMLISHADEIGLMIKYIDNNGFIYFREIGGIDSSLLPGLKVDIHNKKRKIVGIIGKQPIHMLSNENKEVPKIENLWIDIGAKNKEEALVFVSIGDYITFSSSIDRLSNNLLAAKSIDNKIGLAIIGGVMQQIYDTDLNCDLYVVSSVQEEIGGRGAITATFGINPDIGIAIDVTHATDYPSISQEKYGEIKLNGGVVIPIGANINNTINDIFMKIAEQFNMKYQTEAVPNATGTDANAIQITRAGIATGLLSIPCRYMHTPNEIVSLEDAESAILLLSEFCKSISKETSFIPY